MSESTLGQARLELWKLAQDDIVEPIPGIELIHLPALVFPSPDALLPIPEPLHTILERLHTRDLLLDVVFHHAVVASHPTIGRHDFHEIEQRAEEGAELLDFVQEKFQLAANGIVPRTDNIVLYAVHQPFNQLASARLRLRVGLIVVKAEDFSASLFRR